MKFGKIFGLSLSALFMMTACSEKSEEEGEPEVQKSTECKLSSFTITAGECTIETFIDQSAKTIEISYLPNELAALVSGTAEYKISENATISPDPAAETDYTQEGLSFTVTAEDGTTKATYSIVLAPAEYSESIEMIWEKKYGKMGVHDRYGGGSLMAGAAFSGLNLVFSDLTVVSLEGKKIGYLNTEGLTLDTYNGQLGSMTNDEHGVLVAACCYGGTDEGEGVVTDFYAWIDGYDQAPTLIHHEDFQCYYLSVTGDVANADFILCWRDAYTFDEEYVDNYQMQNIIVYNGSFEDFDWYGPFIPHSSMLGNWGQMLSFPTNDPLGDFVCWSSWYAEDYGWSSLFLTYHGQTEEMMHVYELEDETELFGTLAEGETGAYNFGNFSHGHARAFNYNGENYVSEASNGWASVYLTIQSMDDPSKYLLETTPMDYTDETYPISAYVYDEATGAAYIAFVGQNVAVQMYKLSTERL